MSVNNPSATVKFREFLFDAVLNVDVLAQNSSENIRLSGIDSDPFRLELIVISVSFLLDTTLATTTETVTSCLMIW